MKKTTAIITIDNGLWLKFHNWVRSYFIPHGIEVDDTVCYLYPDFAAFLETTGPWDVVIVDFSAVTLEELPLVTKYRDDHPLVKIMAICSPSQRQDLRAAGLTYFLYNHGRIAWNQTFSRLLGSPPQSD